MSKEADKDLLEPPDSPEGRRRRKKSGLRIPSDNVPRNVPVTPITPMPVTESGRVSAVDLVDRSGAHSTRMPSGMTSRADSEDRGESPWDSAPHRAHQTPAEPPNARTLRKEGTPERPDTSTLRKEGTPERPDTSTLRKEGTPERPDASTLRKEGTPERLDARTRDSGAVPERAIEDGGVVEAVLDDPSVNVPSYEEDAAPRAEVPAQRSTPHPPMPSLAPIGEENESTEERARQATPPPSFTIPLVDDDEATEVTQTSAFAMLRADGDPAARSAAPARNTAEARARARPAASDDEDFDTRKTREMPAVSLEELGLFESMLGDGRSDRADSGDAIDIPIEEGELEEISVEDESPPPARAPQSSRGAQRAATVALSDEDLEELIEPIEGPGLGGPGRSPRDPGPGERSRRAAPLDWMPEPGVPAAVAALESGGMESPLDTPLEIGAASKARLDFDHTSEPGEILADELLEEVDEVDVKVGQHAESRSSPPPAPRGTSVNKKPPPSPSSSPSSSQAPARPNARGAGQSKGQPRRKPWFEEIFDEDYLRTLPFLTPQATQAEALFVADALGVEPGSQLLDVGCGYGRHAMELAARGYVVVALDLSLPLLLRGADEAQRRGLNINFVHGDMRELSFEGQFDGAYCLFSTFGYFDDETNKKTVQGLARALRPGARLVLEVLNRDYLITELPTRVWWEGDGCVVLEEVDFNYFSSRIVSTRSVVFDDGRQLEQEISLRSYCLHEFGKLLHGAGFRILEVSGSMATRGRFFGTESREIIVVAEKRRSKDGPNGSSSSGS